MFDEVDALFAGMTRAGALDAVSIFFIDADGAPRIRHNLHLVRNDPVTEPTAASGGDGPLAGNPAATDPPDDELDQVRDIDLLTPEDLERGELAMKRVEATLERRHAGRADGIRDLGRERFMRLRRRKGLPTPD